MASLVSASLLLLPTASVASWAAHLPPTVPSASIANHWVKAARLLRQTVMDLLLRVHLHMVGVQGLPLVIGCR